tara:strand:- start:3339 stop:3689 length:351 start_codon:yes stop_codon:yes gene_type:complete
LLGFTSSQKKKDRKMKSESDIWLLRQEFKLLADKHKPIGKTRNEVIKDLKLLKLKAAIKRRAGRTRVDLSWLTPGLLEEQRKNRKEYIASCGGIERYRKKADKHMGSRAMSLFTGS